MLLHWEMAIHSHFQMVRISRFQMEKMGINGKDAPVINVRYYNVDTIGYKLLMVKQHGLMIVMETRFLHQERMLSRHY